ncbi:histone-lysine N-methyltransferase SETMAR isoform X1 [Pelobates fuscus]|uniref:histone-lysine N-methyltransferase SETMAR isoform X1 n=1 Tax=Pelobates fuscus TaxID=191477 RepID=UPI002FE458D0
MAAVDVTHGLETLPVPVCGPWEELTAFQYTPDLVAGPGAKEDPSEVTILGCDCKETTCAPQTCACLPFGANYVSRAILSSQRPILECNVMCKCGESCTNQETQKGLQFQLQVCRITGKGWGLFTKEDIPSGRFVCEYVGEVLGYDEACRRIHSQESTTNNYIIAVREHLHGGKILQTIVDPTQKGNVGRFLNHSCQPNLFMLPVRTHSMVPRLSLFAARDILAGEELCYDYSGKAFNAGEMSANRECEQRTLSSHKRCLCGTPSCSGYLPFDEWLCE